MFQSKKTAVLGIVQRKGHVAAVTVDNVTRGAVMPHILEKALPKSTIYTDEYRHITRLANRASSIGAFVILRKSM